MFNEIVDAIQDIKNGKMVIVVDDPSRENEGDLVMAGELATSKAINFMATFGKGLICMPVSKEIADNLELSPMTSDNSDPHKTAFTISIDHNTTTTGISTSERAKTIKEACYSNNPKDFNHPGHVFPLIAKQGGVLKRKGHTESAIDLVKLAGLKEVGVICEILNDDGTMKRRDDLLIFAKEHNLKIITISDLQEYLLKETLVIEKVTEANLPTKYGDFKIHGFINKITKEHHIALTIGTLKENPFVRIHSECLTGDALGSKKCDCGEQYNLAMKMISENENGVLIYLRQEGRGIGLINKIKAYHLQDLGYDTVDANIELGFDTDLRKYNEAADILKILNVNNISLLTNNPLKITGLEQYGINVLNRIHIEPNHNEYNEFYLKTKKERMNHKILK